MGQASILRTAQLGQRESSFEPKGFSIVVASCGKGATTRSHSSALSPPLLVGRIPLLK